MQDMKIFYLIVGTQNIDFWNAWEKTIPEVYRYAYVAPVISFLCPVNQTLSHTPLNAMRSGGTPQNNFPPLFSKLVLQMQFSLQPVSQCQKKKCIEICS